MEETKIENQDSTKTDEAVIDTTDASTVDVNALIEQNKKLFARAKTAEQKLKAQTVEKPITTNSSLTPRDILNSEEMKLYRDGYTNDQIEFVMNNGGVKSLEDKNSLVSIALKSAREQAAAEHAVNQTTEGSQMTIMEKTYTPEQLSNMSSAELAKILPHAD